MGKLGLHKSQSTSAFTKPRIHGQHREVHGNVGLPSNQCTSAVAKLGNSREVHGVSWTVPSTREGLDFPVATDIGAHVSHNIAF